MNLTNPCPCGSGIAYQQCCARYIEQGIRPQTAEALMRSRYCAYVFDKQAYIEKTWHPDFRQNMEQNDSAPVEWLRLEVLRHNKGLKKSIVEFNAYYLENGREHCLHEVSEFKKIKTHWYYTQAL